MPNIFIPILKDSVQVESRVQLMRQATDFASKVKQIPD